MSSTPSIGIAVSGYDAGSSEFMAKIAGVTREAAQSKSKFEVTVGIDGKDVAVTLSSPHWSAREGRARRLARAYKNDVWFALFDLTKPVENLHTALAASKRAQSNSLHKDYAVYYLIGNKADLVNERKVTREEVEKIAAENGLRYAEVSSVTGAGMAELLSDAMRSLALKPKKPSLEELLHPEGQKA